MKNVGGLWLPDEDQEFVPSFETEGGFQLDRLYKFLKHVTNFTCAIDGGAHVGSWTRILSAKFRSVYAFEPALDTYECLQKNMMGFENVILQNKALGNVFKNVEMAIDEKYIASGNTGARYVRQATRQSAIEMVPLDSYIFPSIGFIKLDVEGAELLALQGAEKILLKHKPVVMIEEKKNFAERFGNKIGDAPEFLRSLGAREIDYVKADRLFIFD